MTMLYKVLNADGSARMGKGKWPLPNGEPGAWKSVRGELRPCEHGLHLCRRGNLVQWLGPAIFVAEYEGEMVERDDKVVVRRARLVSRIETWTERTARLFACDCAERALQRIDKPDPRSIRAIEVARAFADGSATATERAAAGAAACDAACDAAWASAAGDAACDAAWAAAGDAARAAAAWAAARAAARAAAWDAARAAERAWQTERLFDYLEGRA